MIKENFDDDIDLNPDPVLNQKHFKKMIKSSLGKYIETKDRRYLVVEVDFPVLRVFDGQYLFTINANEIKKIGEKADI